MTLAYPWALGLPLLYILLLLKMRQEKNLVAFPCLSPVLHTRASWKVITRGPLINVLILAGLCLLALAAARPHSVTIIEQSRKTRNIMLVVDVSRSMSGNDFPEAYGYVSRMSGVKTVIAEYVRNRVGESVGLVIFGDRAYLQSPITTDFSLLVGMVEQLEPGMAGDGTAIGDGLGVALKRLRDVGGDTKAIILLTDGANNAGNVSPLKAAKIAKDLGIKIHTIGIGTGQASIPGQVVGGLLTMTVPAVAEYDESTLRQIASATGGYFFNARSLNELSRVYQELDQLDSAETKQPRMRVIEEKFAPYALAGTAALLLSIILATTIYLRVP